MNKAFWLKFSVFNFFLAAVLGVIMRYKIVYSFPFLDQKHLQEAHSHFAFYAWITNAIYVLVVIYLSKMNPDLKLTKYKALLTANIISSFGMLAAFIYGGYFSVSVFFSTTALLVSFVFAFLFYADSLKIQDQSKPWFLAGLFFAVISSLGVFNLGYMSATNSTTQNMFLASEYYYLHFQYNGFFIFSCIGLLLYSLKEIGSSISEKKNKLLFWLMFMGCLIGFGLSILWFKMPIYVFTLIAIATIGQTIGAIMLFAFVKKSWTQISANWLPMQRFILLFAGFAFAVKIALQLGSNIPAVNQFAFGFRNIVIAYLHLVLLMCIAMFLINQILATRLFSNTKPLSLGLKLLLLGIFLNEAVLGLMGVFSITYNAVPYANHALFYISLLMMVALLVIFVNLRFKSENQI
ncbi:hypothetical protein [Chryseobacterium sp. R2A-55]|uniref:hypothetical protein n=1 Tax=Chryseobacterium sp. R2A-55 TaxID=2744445 RepID=UPI001F34D728|nr:hypothetical protein [Chryseobacterium sp. R2A-55]